MSRDKEEKQRIEEKRDGSNNNNNYSDYLNKNNRRKSTFIKPSWLLISVAGTFSLSVHFVFVS